MKGFIFLIIAWVIGFVFAKLTGFSLFESFVIVTIGYVFMKTLDGDSK